MVEMRIVYDGELGCTAEHGPSGSRLRTDAPVDNQGRGLSFSPTDLLATSLGTCIVTTMAIMAERHGWDMSGTSAVVEKTMVADPVRRVGRLTVKIRVPRALDARARETLERTAVTCPVHKSLHPSVEIPVSFEWGPPPAAS